MKKLSQKQRVLHHLQCGIGITQGEALRYLSIGRLASRINDLRNDGWNISTTMVSRVNQFNRKVRIAEYRLESSEQKPKEKPERLYFIVYDKTTNVMIGVADSRRGAMKLVTSYLGDYWKLWGEEKSRDTETLNYGKRTEHSLSVRKITITHCKLNSLRW